MFPTISDYYRNARDAAHTEVESTPDGQAFGMDPEEWIAYLIRKYGMERVEIDPGNPIKMVETAVRGYPAVRVLQAMIWTDTLTVIAKETLVGGGQWLGFDYREFFRSGHPGTIGLTVPQDASEINGARRRIGEYIQSLNSAIDHENQSFPEQIRQIVTGKKTRLKASHEKLDELSAAVGIPLIKKADVSTVVPTAVRVRQTIAPLVPPTPRDQRRPVLEREKFNAIVDLIDNQCRQFELTPTVFQGLPEEALRDIILSSLNAVFEGAAAGEVFRGLGKTDLHLRISKGEVFVSEVKIWSGPASLAEVVNQLLERLTWRDSFGVGIVLSKNADFGAVLRGVEAALPNLPSAVKGSLSKPGENIFTTRFSLPSDSSKQVEIHIRVYNLHTARPSGRTG